jgi:hypothetical protein
MKKYQLTLKDFIRVFDFASKFYIDPSKNTTGRTTSEPRGLGAILDNFTLGKLVEISVSNFIGNKNKICILDFIIKSNNEIKDEADIAAVEEFGILRSPNMFVEIKNTSDKDRWIGLTEEQFNTIQRASNSKKIFFIYATLNSQVVDKNPKTGDLTGMFLKEIENKDKSRIFQNFADLNAECKLEFVINADDIKKYAFPFEKGMNMYETILFKEVKSKSILNKEGFRKDIIATLEHTKSEDVMQITLPSGILPEKKEIYEFKVTGRFKILSKKKTKFIECISNVLIHNSIFGSFNLESGKYYKFNFETLGRNPKLQRNNLFISKKRVYELIGEGKIKKPEEIIEEISEQI